MFQVYCHIHESPVLLGWSRVESMRNSDEGPVIDWHCWCGARGSLIAGVRSEPRRFEPVVMDPPAPADPDGRADATTSDDAHPLAG
jgi:hypothetical protein